MNDPHARNYTESRCDIKCLKIERFLRKTSSKSVTPKRYNIDEGQIKKCQQQIALLKSNWEHIKSSVCTSLHSNKNNSLSTTSVIHKRNLSNDIIQPIQQSISAYQIVPSSDKESTIKKLISPIKVDEIESKENGKKSPEETNIDIRKCVEARHQKRYNENIPLKTINLVNDKIKASKKYTKETPIVVKLDLTISPSIKRNSNSTFISKNMKVANKVALPRKNNKRFDTYLRKRMPTEIPSSPDSSKTVHSDIVARIHKNKAFTSVALTNILKKLKK